MPPLYGKLKGQHKGLGALRGRRLGVNRHPANLYPRVIQHSDMSFWVDGWRIERNADSYHLCRGDGVAVAFAVPS
jgi:hypothetical protein